MAHCVLDSLAESGLVFYGHIIKAFCFCFVVFDLIGYCFWPSLYIYHIVFVGPSRLLVFTPWLMTKTFTSITLAPRVDITATTTHSAYQNQPIKSLSQLGWTLRSRNIRYRTIWQIQVLSLRARLKAFEYAINTAGQH